jgi:hypothetical protein
VNDKMSSLAASVIEHLARRSWRLLRCGQCGVAFLSSVTRSNCGKSGCTPSDMEAKTQRGPLLFPEELWPRIRTMFLANGFSLVNRSDVANSSSRSTRFVGAGVQLFEDAIYDGADHASGALFVPQPAVRLNYASSVASSRATSTSFMNVCTEQAQSRMCDFILHLDLWLGFLRKIYTRLEDLVILLPSDLWSGGPLAGNSIVFEIGGIEIGDAIFIDQTVAVGQHLLPIVDFSFGLERLAYASRCDIPYSALIGPLPEAVSDVHYVALDRVRTATLLVMAGVTPSSSSHGRVVRQLLSEAAEWTLEDFHEAVLHFYNYWSLFFLPARTFQECHSMIALEFSRARVAAIAKSRNFDKALRRMPIIPSSTTACRELLAAGLRFNDLCDCLGGSRLQVNDNQ